MRSSLPGLALSLATGLSFLSGCATLEPGRADDAEAARMQTADQAAQARRFLYNEQLRSAEPVAPAQAPVTKQVAACEYNDFALRDLLVGEISLSNLDVRSAAATLAVMGYRLIDLGTVDFYTQPERFGCDQLPIVVLPTSPEDEQLTFSGGEQLAGNAAAALGNLIINPLRRGNSADLDRLLVFYHPEREQALAELRELVERRIDSASTQVFIETLVVEINREDSRELGVQWQTANLGTQTLLTLGQLEPGSGDSLGFERNTRTENGAFVFNPGTGVQVKLRALVESGRAQIISRPSVLALSNRQAVIQIVDILQTPVLSSRVSDDGRSVTISDYAFDPMLVGITLNLRPRVSADRQWVSMEIDATVDAEVDENAGEVFAPDFAGGRILLAEKPGAASRKVRTFARIPDRTPIIIGGLAAADRENQKGRVPGLGELPLIGGLFGSTDNEVKERELIIVLTPYVLSEDGVSVRANSAERNHLLQPQQPQPE